MERRLTRKPLEIQSVQEDSSRADIAIKFVSAMLGIGLVGIGMWGFGATADFERHVAALYARPSDDQVTGVTFALVCMVMFAPCLAGGAFLLWRTFAPDDNSCLVPLRTFNFILAFKILRDTRRKDPHDESRIDILLLRGEQELLRPPAEKVHMNKNS